jgi:hypothetical protein
MNKKQFNVLNLSLICFTFIIYFLYSKITFSENYTNLHYFIVLDFIFLILSSFYLNIKYCSKNILYDCLQIVLSLLFLLCLYLFNDNSFYLINMLIFLIFINISQIYYANYISDKQFIYNIYSKTINFFLLFSVILNILFNLYIFVDIIKFGNSPLIASFLLLCNLLFVFFLYIQNTKNIHNLNIDFNETIYHVYYLSYLFIILCFPFIFVHIIVIN